MDLRCRRLCVAKWDVDSHVELHADGVRTGWNQRRWLSEGTGSSVDSLGWGPVSVVTSATDSVYGMTHLPWWALISFDGRRSTSVALSVDCDASVKTIDLVTL